MKAKLMAILATIVLLAGCQADTNLDDKTPTEFDIDNTTTTENVVSEETNATEENTDNQINETNLETDQDSEETHNSEMETVADENDVPTNNEEQQMDITSSEENLAQETENTKEAEVEMLGSIPNDNIKSGVLEACFVLENIHKQLNAEGLELVEFEGIYEPYYVVKAYPTQTALLNELQKYFTEETARDLVAYWGLIENNGQLLAPELHKSVGYSTSDMDVKVPETQEGDENRFINLSFQLNNEKRNSLLLLKHMTNENVWKLSTIPGKGLLTSHDGQFIRDVFWIEGNTQWNWPVFIATEDKAWTGVMETLKQEIQESIKQKSESFTIDEKFARIGAEQLSYWITWNYAEPNPDYPYVHVVESEYIKYGIHPNHTRRTVTLSKETNELLTLNQIYKDKEAFEKIVNIYVDGYMRENKEAFYNDVFFEGITENTQFYLTESGVVFYFQLYEYAPYAYGYPEIEVPFVELKDVLTDQFQQFVIEPSNDIIDE